MSIYYYGCNEWSKVTYTKCPWILGDERVMTMAVSSGWQLNNVNVLTRLSSVCIAVALQGILFFKIQNIYIRCRQRQIYQYWKWAGPSLKRTKGVVLKSMLYFLFSALKYFITNSLIYLQGRIMEGPIGTLKSGAFRKQNTRFLVKSILPIFLSFAAY